MDAAFGAPGDAFANDQQLTFKSLCIRGVLAAGNEDLPNDRL
jgi:hypothetical protein